MKLNRKNMRSLKRGMESMARAFEGLNEHTKTTALVLTSLAFVLKPLNWPKDAS